MRGALGWTTLLTGGCLVANPVYVADADGDASGSGTGPMASTSMVGETGENPRPATSGATGESGTEPGTGEQPPPPSTWWDTAWNYRQKIRWEAVDLDEATNVIVRVDIDPQPGMDYFSSDGQDIRFVTDEDEVLVHELERWDDERGIAWVRVPRVGDPEPTRFFMYHGNPSAPPPTAEVPFSEAFSAVWHLSSAADSSGLDNALDLRNTDLVQAQIWLGAEFTDVTGPVTASGASDFSNLPANGTTVSGWLRLADPGKERMGVYSSLSEAGNGLEVHVGFVDGATSILVRRNLGATFYEARADLPNPERGWWYFAARYSDDTGAAFTINGEDVDLASETSLISGPVEQGATPMLGDSGTGQAARLLGTLDEVRVANQRTGDAWLEADYRSVAGSLISLDPVVTRPR